MADGDGDSDLSPVVLALDQHVSLKDKSGTTSPVLAGHKRHPNDDDGYTGSQDEAGESKPRDRSPRPQKKIKFDQGVSENDSGSDELDDGEIRDLQSDGEFDGDNEEQEQQQTEGEDEDGEVVHENAKPPPQTGWNRGVTAGLRTSFTSAGKAVHLKPMDTRPEPTPMAQVPATPNEVLSAPPSAADREALATHSKATGKVDDFVLSPSVSSSILQLNPYKDENTYRAWFITWLLEVLALNKDNRTAFDPTRLCEAYNKWLVGQELSSKKRRAASASASHLVREREYKKMMEDARTGVSPGLLKELTLPRPARVADNDWEIPVRVDISNLNIAPDNRAGWGDLFERWCRDFLKINRSRLEGGKKIGSTVLSYYRIWLKGSPKAMQRIASKKAGALVKDGKTEAILAEVWRGDATLPAGNGAPPSSLPSTATQDYTQLLGNENAISTIGHGQNGDVSMRNCAPMVMDGEMSLNAPNSDATGSTLESGEEDESLSPSHPSSSEYLRRYFPGLPEGYAFCALCASPGHRGGKCPSLRCRFCQNKHPSYACPLRHRCTKCKQLGHAREDCREKLASAPDEIECAICQSTEHTEEMCDELWRSFEPAPSLLKKVRILPVFCYFCGSEGHYGAECGLSRGKSTWSRRETWCGTSLDLYQDSSSSQIALALRAPAAGAFATMRAADERPDFGGRSIVPQSHVFFEADDDDENESFIHAPVQKKAKPGNIKFSGKHGSKQESKHLPPLPPGPPPPLPQGPPPTYRQRTNGLPPARPRGNRRRGRGGQPRG